MSPISESESNRVRDERSPGSVRNSGVHLPQERPIENSFIHSGIHTPCFGHNRMAADIRWEGNGSGCFLHQTNESTSSYSIHAQSRKRIANNRVFGVRQQGFLST